MEGFPRPERSARGSVGHSAGRKSRESEEKTTERESIEIVPDPDWWAIGQEIQSVLMRKRGMPKGIVEDVTQDALLCMVVLLNEGSRINCHVAFGVACARKRMIDELRKRRRRGEILDPELDDWACIRDVEQDALNWKKILWRAGWAPSAAQERLLDAIASGCRGSRKIANALGVDVKTAREGRLRLRRWLQEILSAPPPARRLALYTCCCRGASVVAAQLFGAMVAH